MHLSGRERELQYWLDLLFFCIAQIRRITGDAKTGE